MSEELNAHLSTKARELCFFYDYLSFLDQGTLLSLLAIMSEDDNRVRYFVSELEKNPKYQKIIKNPMLI